MEAAVEGDEGALKEETPMGDGDAQGNSKPMEGSEAGTAGGWVGGIGCGVVFGDKVE
jgi:hypothetical protein